MVNCIGFDLCTMSVSKKMVGMMTCGDVFKTVYFVLRKAPAQFWLCGGLQVSIDLAIFVQVSDSVMFLFDCLHRSFVDARDMSKYLWS